MLACLANSGNNIPQQKFSVKFNKLSTLHNITWVM